MANKPLQPKREMKNLCDLPAHPLQALYFDPLGDHDIQALAASIRRKLKQPIEVMPPGNRAGLPAYTILDGHQRKRALEINGETETEVLVRFDLHDADAATVEHEFLGSSKDRKQLDRLAKGRIALRQYVIERGKPLNPTDHWDHVEARDRVGKAIGMSGRNLSRYFRVLRTPIEVQNAFRKEVISLIMAEKVADLSPTVQDTIARRIRAGEDAKAVVSEFVAPPKGRQPRARHPIDVLRQTLNDLAGRIDEVDPIWVGMYAGDLERGRDLIDRLLAGSADKDPGQRPPPREEEE